MKPPILATSLLALIVLSLGAQEAYSQVQISGDARLGITFPLGDLAGDELEAGMVLGAGASVHVRPNLRLYTTFNRHQFRCGDGCVELGPGSRSTGFGTGIQYRFLSPQEATWWARVGGLAHHFRSDLSAGDWNVGFEAAGGIDVPVSENYMISPHLGVVNHGLPGSLTARYLTFGVGLQRTLR